MTVDEILDGYESEWRAAALRDQRQFFGDGFGGTPNLDYRGEAGPATCAAMVPRISGHIDLMVAATSTKEPSWRCPDCGYVPTCGGALYAIMAHLNNAHCWTWDMFAGKFRDALAQGMKV